jgi:hypothetical protein
VGAVPTWLLVGGIVCLSTAFRFALAIRDPGPWIFQDEIVYSELAKSLAYASEPALRGAVGTGGFGLVYPLLIAPAYLLFDAVPSAYDAVRLVNSLLMSLAAVPAYLLARRLAARELSLLVALLAVAIPSLGYTGTVMTENAFYPISVLWLLLLVLALERPTAVRQLAVLGVLAIAFFTRAQAVSFIAIFVGAIALFVLLEARVDRAPFVRAAVNRLTGFWPTWIGLSLAVALVIFRQLIQGESLSGALGAYAGVTSFQYDWRGVLDWALWHLGEIDLVVGIFPFAAFLLLVGFVAVRPRAYDPPLRAFIAAGVSFVAIFTIVVGAYASDPTGLRIEERNYFHVIPVFFVALAAWIQLGAPRPWPGVALALIPAVMLPARIPFDRFLNDVATHSTMGLLPLWRIQHKYFAIGTVPEVVFLAALFAAALFVLVPRRIAWVLLLCVLAFYAGTFRMIEGFTHKASVDATNVGAPKAPRDWVDRAVGRGADVATVWWGGSVLPFWQVDFFNRSVGQAYTLPGRYDGLPLTQLQPRTTDGLLRDDQGRTVAADYVLTDQYADFGGSPVARDRRAGMAVYKMPKGPLFAHEKIDGLFPDGWAGGKVHYVRYGCRTGALAVRVRTRARLHEDRPLTITAVPKDGRPVRLALGPGRWTGRLLVPLRPKAGLCDVDFTISRVSLALILGGGDIRLLSARFERFDELGRRHSESPELARSRSSSATACCSREISSR